MTSNHFVPLLWLHIVCPARLLINMQHELMKRLRRPDAILHDRCSRAEMTGVSGRMSKHFQKPWICPKSQTSRGEVCFSLTGISRKAVFPLGDNNSCVLTSEFSRTTIPTLLCHSALLLWLQRWWNMWSDHSMWQMLDTPQYRTQEVTHVGMKVRPRVDVCGADENISCSSYLGLDIPT